MTAAAALLSRMAAPVAAFAFAILLAGCKVFETEAPPPRFSPPAAFDAAPGRDGSVSSLDLARWWTLWRDPVLDRLVKDALDANTDLRIARARVAEARSLAAVVASQLSPTIGAKADQWGGAVQWRNPAVDLIPGGSHTVDAHLAGVVASWDPDIFEGRADDAEAARDWALSVAEQLHGAQTIVVAEVAQNYQEARGLQRRLAVLDASIAALAQLSRYIEGRYAAGQALAYDMTEARERLESQRAKRPMLASLLDMRERRLAALTGRLPEKVERLGPPDGFAAPAAPTGQMPSDVLERRPDVRASVLLVMAQTFRLSSAKAELLPRFQINFFGGDGRLHFEGIPGLQGTGGLAGLTVQLPIFTGGRIAANIAANDARLEQAAAAYDQSLLRALEDVENAYSRRCSLDRRAAEIRAALESAKRKEKASLGLYEGWRKTFGDALSAKLDAFQRADDLITAQMEQASATVRLYLALGGGW